MSEKRKSWGPKTTIKELFNGDCTVEELVTLLSEVMAGNPVAHVAVEKSNSVIERITDIFNEIGIPAHMDGFRYLRCAIEMAYKDNTYLKAMTKRLYPDVAKKCNSTVSRVEVRMRYSIECAWERGNIDAIDKYFGCTIKTKMAKATNSEFIAKIVDILQLQDGTAN